MLSGKHLAELGMPRGPKGERRPADAIRNAIMIARIATGEIVDHTETIPGGKDPAAVALGRKGATALAPQLSDQASV
jgi:hypothetical protein